MRVWILVGARELLVVVIEVVLVDVDVVDEAESEGGDVGNDPYTCAGFTPVRPNTAASLVFRANIPTLMHLADAVLALFVRPLVHLLVAAVVSTPKSAPKLTVLMLVPLPEEPWLLLLLRGRLA